MPKAISRNQHMHPCKLIIRFYAESDISGSVYASLQTYYPLLCLTVDLPQTKKVLPKDPEVPAEFAMMIKQYLKNVGQTLSPPSP
jgi:hypothetical protein